MENFILIGVFVILGILLRRIEAFPKDSAQVLNMFAPHASSADNSVTNCVAHGHRLDHLGASGVDAHGETAYNLPRGQTTSRIHRGREHDERASVLTPSRRR